MSSFSAGLFAGSAAALVGFVCAASSAVAQTAMNRESSAVSKEVQLHFDGPPSCDDQRLFLKAFERRLREVRLVPTTKQAVVRVQIGATDQGFQASLTIRLANGETLQRAISASSCAEATDVIAFVTAVALDPASRDPLEVGEPEFQAEHEPEPIQQEATPSRSPPHGDRWSMGLAASGKLGIAPQPMAGGYVGAGWQTAVSGFWAPSLRGTLGASVRRGYQATDGIADFMLYEAVLLACPSRAQWGPVVLRPCFAGGGGALRAMGRETFAGRASTRPWAWSGAALLLGVQIHSHLNLTLDAGIGFPWVRDRFLFEGQEFHTPSAAFGSASIGFEVFFRDRSVEVVH